jgi:CubicO group peptidase (beta-lactamase class C family)
MQGGNPMRQKRKRYFLTSFLAVLCVGIGFWGYATAQTPATEQQAKNKAAELAIKEENILIQGAVTHVREPDGSSNAIIDIVIGNEFKGALPDEIDTITVAGPKGDLSIGKDDFNYYPQFRDFWIRIPGPPETGTYTFTVTSGNRSGSATDTQSDPRTLPIPDTGTFRPAEGETITMKPSHFSWAGVDAEGPLFYRIDIKDMEDNYIFRSSYIKDMLSVRLPPDVLKEGQTYRWRVRVADGINWIKANNRSHNQWQTFTTGSKLTEMEYRYLIPLETGDGWQTSSLNEEGIGAEKINELMQSILKGDDKVKNIHSVLLAKNGKLVLEEYFYGNHRNHIHHLQSDTKSVISILIGVAIDKRLIKNVKQPIFDFFPEITPANFDGEKRKITIEHLLMMAPGLECRDSYRYRWQGLYEMRRSSDWTQFMLDLPMAEMPGTRFEYCNGASFLLSAIIQKAAGMNALEFAKKHLFNPLGIDHFNWPPNPQGITIGWADLQLRPRDMAKIGQMMLKGGRWRGKQIISQNWVNQSTRAYIRAGGYDYGYQWWRGKTIANNQVIDAFWAWGHGGQFIIVLPELDTVVVLTAKHLDNPGYSKRAFGMLTQHIMPALIPHSQREKSAVLDREVMDAYVGKYEFKSDREHIFVEVMRVGNKLFGKSDDEEKVELFPETESQFYGTSQEIGGFKLKFVKDQMGDINQFILHCAPRFAFMRIPFDKIK